MDYIENAKKEIRETWFKGHSVIEKIGDAGFQKFTWGKKGTNSYRVNYVLSGNMVFVSGDLGVAAYSLTELANIEKIATYGLSYFTGKLVACQHDKYDFNYKQAQARIKEYFLDWRDVSSIEDLSEDDHGLFNDLLEESLNWNTVEQFNMGVFNVYRSTNAEWFDSEDASVIADTGSQLSYSIIAYWVGLQMIADELRKSICPTCDKQFTPKDNEQYCSDLCEDSTIASCMNCNVDYKYAKSTAEEQETYCSKSCEKEYETDSKKE